MLEESSTTTATIFCWGRSVATLRAGCHSISSRIEASSVCSSQTIAERTPVTRAPLVERLQTSTANPSAANMIAAASSHIGHPPSRTNVPFEKTDSGYLKNSSNIVNCVAPQCVKSYMT